MNITSHIRPIRGALAVSTVAVGVCASAVIALGPTNQVHIVTAPSPQLTQGPATPWNPDCWGPFSWNTGGCQWSPMTGPNNVWAPSTTGPGQFNGGGNNPGNGMGPGMMGPGMMGPR